jgi:hypothetical protein
MPTPTMCDRLAALFRSRPGQEIGWRELAHVAGGAAWRTRCADLRRAPYNLDVRNRWWNVTCGDGSTYRESVYWVVIPQQDEEHEEEGTRAEGPARISDVALPQQPSETSSGVVQSELPL